MRVFVFSVIAVILGCTVSYGQQASVKRCTARFVGSAVLRDVDDKYNASISNEEMPDPDGNIEQEKLRTIKDIIAARYPHKFKTEAKKSTSVLNAPTIGVNFVADTSSGIPPDNYTAVSTGGKVVNVMNQTIAVHNAASGAMLLRKTLYAFSLSVGLINTATANYNYRYDPKVVYDPVADRFICIMLNGIDQYNWIVLGFSQSNDPAGGWNFYKFYGDYTANTTWFDYPAISITKNEFFLTGNKIIYDSSWQGGFTKSLIYQVRKQDGYNGDSVLTYQIWDSIQYNHKFLRCLYPLNPSDSLLGPDQYFLSNRNFDVVNDSVFIVHVADTIGSADQSLTVVPVVSSTTSYGVPPDGRQPDTNLSLATNDGRILGGFIQGSQMQFVSTSINPANGASAVYHGIIDNFNTTPIMHAQIFSIDTLDFGYPNVSYAGMPGQSIISFDFSGPKTYPGFGAIFSDGTNYSDMVVIKSGDTTIDQEPLQKEQRWGDYSGSQPAWGTPGTVWVEGIYGKRKFPFRGTYGNYMAQLISPYRESVPLAHAAIPESKLYPNPVIAFVSFEFAVSKAQSFTFLIYDMQGRVVDKMLEYYCQEGKNVIQFNMGSLKPGTYLLKAIGRDGEQIAIHSFVRE